MTINEPAKKNLSLDEIEGQPWGQPPADATRLMQAVYELRRKPVGQLDVEDLRLLLGQQISVDILAPYAVDRLQGSPLAEGDYYPGDLLVAVLKLPAVYWQNNPAQSHSLKQILAQVDSLDLDAHGAPAEVIKSAVRDFLNG